MWSDCVAIILIPARPGDRRGKEEEGGGEKDTVTENGKEELRRGEGMQ